MPPLCRDHLSGRQRRDKTPQLEIGELESGRGDGGGEERQVSDAGGLEKGSAGFRLLQASCVSGRQGTGKGLAF